MIPGNHINSQRAINRWVTLSAVILVPVLFGLQLEEGYANEFSSCRQYMSQALLLFVAGPLLFELFVDLKSNLSVWFRARVVMLASSVVVNISLIIMDAWTGDSVVNFVSACLPLIILRDNIMRGCLVSYMYHKDSPASLMWAADVYFIICSCLVFARLYTWFIIGEALVWACRLNIVAMIAQIFMLLACGHCLATAKESSDLRKGIYFAMGGLVATGFHVVIFSSFATHMFLVSSTLNFFVTLGAFYLSKLWHRDDCVNKRGLLKAKREFVRYIAHEMRIPLNVTVI